MKLINVCVGLAVALVSLSAYSLTVTVPVAAAEAKMPAIYTCDGSNITPPIVWKNLPPNTKSLALIVSDPDAPKGVFFHWIVYNLPVNISGLAAGAPLPGGAMSGLNSTGKAGYYGPCPPKGAVHHYLFTLYALNAVLPPNTNATLNSFADYTLQKASYSLRYWH